MLQPDRRRQLSILLATLLALGLIAFAVINVLHWYRGGAKAAEQLQRLQLHEAPMMVQEAAAKLSSSRAGYAIPFGNATYVVISTGPGGERIDLAGVKVEQNYVDINLRTSSAGERLLIAKLNRAVSDTRMVQFNLDGHFALIPSLVNAHNLPLVALPDKQSFVITAPAAESRIMGNELQVSGYARVFEGQFSITVFSANKGRILGEVSAASAAVGAPNWGSFKVNVPLNLPAGITEGVLLVYDQESGAKVAVPIRFGTK